MEKKNKAFVGLGSCDNVQTERIIFEYANWPRIQIKRTGLSSWSIQLVRPAGTSSWSVQLVRPAGPSSWFVQLVRPAGPNSRPIYTLHLTHCILHTASFRYLSKWLKFSLKSLARSKKY